MPDWMVLALSVGLVEVPLFPLLSASVVPSASLARSTPGHSWPCSLTNARLAARLMGVIVRADCL